MVRGGSNGFIGGFLVWKDGTLYRNDSLPPGQYLTMVQSEAPEPPTYDNDGHDDRTLVAPFFGIFLLLAILGAALALWV